MAKIVAKRPILLANRIYQPGEPLPAWDAAVTAAWLEAGSAVLVSDETDKTETNKDAAPEGESPAGGNSTAENGDGETSDAGNSEETPDTAATPGETTADEESETHPSGDESEVAPGSGDTSPAAEEETPAAATAGNSEETPDTAATPGDGKGKSTKGKSRKK